MAKIGNKKTPRVFNTLRVHPRRKMEYLVFKLKYG
jgi:hypothetical protein